VLIKAQLLSIDQCSYCAYLSYITLACIFGWKCFR